MNKLRMSNPLDYASFPLATFNLAGYQVVLPVPNNSGSVATDLAKTDINLDDFGWCNSDLAPTESVLSLIYNLSWDIKRAGSTSPMGRLRLGASIMENRSNQFNFADDESFKNWMLARNRENYGTLNDEIKKERELNGVECLPEHLFLFAEKPEDIFITAVDGRKWFGEKSGCAQGGSEISLSLRTPLNTRYSLNLEFDWSAPPETYEAFKAEVDDLQLEYLHKVRLIPNT